MADPTTYRPSAGTIPLDPGVYKFRDERNEVIYVGKAKNLRARLSSYFQDLTQLHPRTRQMVTTASSVEWTVVANEVEALQLEYTWIKKFDPRFNVKYRDDKSYPMLAVSVKEQFPRAFFYRGPRRKGVRYFGPYSQAWAVRQILDLLTRVFPLRTCSRGVFQRHQRLQRPCLLGYIDKCAAPCIGRVTVEDHREIVRGFCSFLAGNTDVVVRDLNKRMLEAAEDLDFELAARLRDDLDAIRTITEQQAVVLGDGTDADIIAIDSDELEAAIQVFQVRAGRIRGQRGWVVERPAELSEEELLKNFLVQFYTDLAEQESLVDHEAPQRRGVDQYSHGEQTPVGSDARLVARTTRNAIPKEILVDFCTEEWASLEDLCTQLRGANVEIRRPQRGDKAALMVTVNKNATDALRQHKLHRVGDFTARTQALQDIGEALGMDEPPLRIECIDISHIQGTDVVASLVVFEDGLPKKADYRRYKIREAAGDGHSNDVASIAEVTRRRFLRYKEDALLVPSDEGEEQPETRRFAYPPQLFVVDGGKPQVDAAAAVLEELGIEDVTLVGIAKRMEEIWMPDDDEPLILPRSSQALFLIQHIRDEAHRFAISFHRQQRSQRMRASALDAIPGLGQQRRKDLIKHFGSVKRIKEASQADLEQVTGIGPKLAATIYDALHLDAPTAVPKESEHHTPDSTVP